MKKIGLKYIFIVLTLTFALLISINLDRIKFGLGLIDIYKNNITENPQVNNDSPNNSRSIPLDNPLDKIINESDTNPVENITSNEAIISPDSEAEVPDKKNDESIVEKPIEKSEKTITEKYNKEFIKLQVEFESELNGLINSAFAEYSSGHSSKSELASKYLDKGVAMEKSADSRFYSLLRSYENELKENAFSTSIVKEVENYYESFKKDRKSSIISKGMEMVKK